MDEPVGTEELIYKFQNNTPINHLNSLKEDKFLSQRIFKRISENMHYEIFKYLTSSELIIIRETTLGRYQLTSNRMLRARIKNYFRKIVLDTVFQDINQDSRKIQLIFEQSGKNSLNFEENQIGITEQRAGYIAQLIALNQDLKEIILGIYIYILYLC